jgi:hypothetical protein
MKVGISLILFIGIIISLIMSLVIGENLYLYDIENNNTRDIYNFTEHSFSQLNNSFEMYQYNSSYKTFGSERLSNIFSLTANYLIDVSFESSKSFIEIGYNSKGKYNIGYFLKFLYIIIWITLICILFYPVLIIGVLIFELIKYIKNKKNIKNVRL